MRYLLLFVGLSGLAFGGLLASFSKTESDRQFWQMVFLLGAVWGAAGFATVDIVSAIGRQRASAAGPGGAADPRRPDGFGR